MNDLPIGYQTVPTDDLPREPLKVTVTAVHYTPINGNHRGTITMTLSDGTEQLWEGDHESFSDIQRNITRTVDNYS